MSEEFDSIDIIDRLVDLVEAEGCSITFDRDEDSFLVTVDGDTAVYAKGRGDTLKSAIMAALQRTESQTGAVTRTTHPRESSSGMGS